MTGRQSFAGVSGRDLNREFTHRRGAEVFERFELDDTQALLAVLAERFGLRLPADTPLDFP